MKTLVLGATGHIGNAVVRELLHRGHQVTGAGRRGHQTANLVGVALHYLSGDLEAQGQLDEWVRGHDAVVDAAAPYPIALPQGKAATDQLLREVVRRTQNLLRTVRKHRARLAYVSSFGTLPQQRTGLDRWASDLMQRLHPYFAVKHQMETALLDFGRRGHPVIIVNPTGCLGPWDCKERRRCFVPALLSGEMPAATDQMLNVIDVRDVAIALVTALERDHHNGVIPLVGHNISNEVLFRWICEAGGVAPPPMVAPSSAGVIGSYLAEIGLRAFKVETPLPALIAMLTYMHGYLAPSPAQLDLGLVLRPLSATIIDTIKWYRTIKYC